MVTLAHRWMLERTPSKVQMLAAAAKGQETAVEDILLGTEYRTRLGL